MKVILGNSVLGEWHATLVADYNNFTNLKGTNYAKVTLYGITILRNLTDRHSILRN